MIESGRKWKKQEGVKKESQRKMNELEKNVVMRLDLVFRAKNTEVKPKKVLECPNVPGSHKLQLKLQIFSTLHIFFIDFNHNKNNILDMFIKQTVGTFHKRLPLGSRHD